MRPRFAGGQVTLGQLLRAAGPLAGNLAASLTGKALARAPAFVTWALTERCQLRCRHCDMGHPTGELSPEARLDLAESLGRSAVWGVSLIGGEPTLAPDLVALARRLKDHGKFVSLGTSGHHLGRHLDGLLDAGIDQITFSVDSHLAEVHDAFRGRPGLFDGVVQAAERIRGQAGRRPQVQVRCTINRTNYRSLEAYLAFWAPRADNLLLQIIQDNGIHQVRDPRVMFRPEDRPALEAAIAEVMARHPSLRTPYHAQMARYVFEPEALRQELGFRCLLVPATSAVILPDGGVKICYGREDSRIGDVGERSLEEIWQAAHTRRTRARMQSKDYGCMCWEQACSGNLHLVAAGRRTERVLGAVGLDWAL